MFGPGGCDPTVPAWYAPVVMMAGVYLAGLVIAIVWRVFLWLRDEQIREHDRLRDSLMYSYSFDFCLRLTLLNSNQQFFKFFIKIYRDFN